MISPPLNPPTDHLSKFLAIGGVVVLLVSIFGPLYEHHDLDQKETALRTEITASEIQNGVLQERARRNLGMLHRFVAPTVLTQLDNDGKGVASLMPVPNDLQRKSDEYDATEKELAVLWQAWSHKKQEIEDKQSEIDVVRTHVITIDIVAWFGLVIGALMSLVGFPLWWNFQKTQDAILCQQLQSTGTVRPRRLNTFTNIMIAAGVAVFGVSFGVPQYLAHEMQSDSVQATRQLRQVLQGVRPFLVKGMTEEEIQDLKKEAQNTPPPTYEQREAVLRKLVDAEPQAQPWLDLYHAMHEKELHQDGLKWLAEKWAFWRGPGLALGVVLILCGFLRLDQVFVRANCAIARSPSVPPMSPQLPRQLPAADRGDEQPNDTRDHA